MALQALAKYAEVTHSSRLNLTISLASTNMDLQERLVMTEENSAILQAARIPSIPTGLFVNAEGEGCALLQASFLIANQNSIHHIFSEWNQS